MMNYILNENIALRSWWLVPYAYYIKNQKNARGLKKEQFEILLKCDGKTELENSEALQRLVEQGFCRIAREGERLSEWQNYKKCDNRYFPAMDFMLTEKCNLNCLHCFNASDNCRMHSEYTLEEAEHLLCEAEACGIHAIMLTGGEPMLHPHFMDIVRSIYAHGMYVFEINTNCHFITQKVLDEMKAIGCVPKIKTSFDGVGHHDWLRNHKGEEKITLDAIRLCVENGFPVMVHTNVHRLNKDSMLETARLLDSLGVEEMRVIRTCESPRWTENAGDNCLTTEEYYDEMLKLSALYSKTDCKMHISIWHFADIYPQSKHFGVRTIGCEEGQYRDSLPVCGRNRSMVMVAADGNLYPCQQVSGYYRMKGDVLGNVKQNGLAPYLREGKYLNEICTTLGDLKNANRECAECRYFRYCLGGCRAMGILFGGSKTGTDRFNCLFFKGHYFKKLAEALPDYQPFRVLPEELQ